MPPNNPQNPLDISNYGFGTGRKPVRPSGVFNYGTGGFDAPGQMTGLTDYSATLGSVPGLDTGAVTQPGVFSSAGIMGQMGPNGWQPGWGMDAFNVIAGGANLYMGAKQIGLGEDAINENQRQFDLNYGIQRDLTNRQIEARYNDKVAAAGGANSGYESVESYMSRNRIV